jgi:hypothetical protein
VAKARMAVKMSNKQEGRPRGLKPTFLLDPLRSAEAPLFHVAARHLMAVNIESLLLIVPIILSPRSIVPIMGSKLYRDWLAVGFGGFEELAWLEAEHAGENVGGE